MTHILIVGGYGQVGARIARRLTAAPDLEVVLAGRSIEKARAMAAAMGCSAVRIDLADASTWDAAIQACGIVLVCMDQKDDAFVRRILGTGRVYMDITANAAFLREAEALDGFARQSEGLGILSIGFAPGLTNLLARAAATRLDVVRNVRIGILLGTGDAHGEAAIDWVLREAARRPHDPPETMRFAGSSEPVPVWSFPFPDQDAVARALGVEAGTFLTFDRPSLSRLAFRLAPLLRGRERLRGALARLLARFRLGSDRAALCVEAAGLDGGRPALARSWFEGHGEAEVTSVVAACAVETVARRRAGFGVRHLDEIMTLDALLPALRQAGGRVGHDPLRY